MFFHENECSLAKFGSKAAGKSKEMLESKATILFLIFKHMFICVKMIIITYKKCFIQVNLSYLK